MALFIRRGIRVYSERAVDESCLRSIVEAGVFMRRGEILKHEAEVRALCGRRIIFDSARSCLWAGRLRKAYMNSAAARIK